MIAPGALRIREGRLGDPQIIALLDLHARSMIEHSPRGACHFLDLSGLKTRDVTFHSGWEGDTLLGTGPSFDAALRSIRGMASFHAPFAGYEASDFNRFFALALD